MTPQKIHMGIVADTGCVICREFMGCSSPAEVHHIAEGSGERSDYMTAGLCPEHHRGATGLHGMGVKAFCRLWGLPNEFALVGLVNKWRGK